MCLAGPASQSACSSLSAVMTLVQIMAYGSESTGEGSKRER